MKSLSYPRGSEWNKWDLHVHTPVSHSSNYRKDSDNEKAWENFILDLENLDKSIKVLGINDYLSIEGYKRVLAEKKEGRLNNIDLILPVVEFRIDKFAGVNFGNLKRINLHIIFSNKLATDKIQRRFLDILSESYVLSPKVHSSVNADWEGGLDITSLEELGKLIRETSPTENFNESDFELGFNNLNFNRNKLLEKLNTPQFKEQYLVAVGKTEWDQLKWSDSSISEKKDIINKTHIVFTAAESVEKYINAKNSLTENKVNDLLLDCSDAHHFSHSNHKDRIGNCNTWIKANPTFEGLKQILYDRSRVKVQETRPEQKPLYSYISKVTFKEESSEFPVDPIYFNSNLNSIIGGKSSGKSLLLHSIAKTIDKKHVDELNKIYDPKSKSEKYKEIYDKIQFEVEWADGEKYTLNGDELQEPRQITYLPQMFINKVLEDGSKELNNLIVEILSENENFREHTQKLDNNISKLINNSDALFSEIDSEFKDYYRENNILKNLGSEDAVRNEISRLESELNMLNSEVTQELRNEYINLKNSEQALSGNILKIDEYIKCLKSFLSKYTEYSDRFLNEINNFSISATLLSNEEYVTSLNEIKDTIKTSFIDSVSEKTVEKLNNLINEQDKLKEDYLLQLEVIQSNIKDHEALLSVETALQETTKLFFTEKEKLENILSRKKSIEATRNKILNLKKDIITQYTSIFEEYIAFSKKISEIYSILSDDINLHSSVEFDSKNFSDIFYKTNNTIYSKFREFFTDKVYNYNENSHFSNITEIFDHILEKYFEEDSENIIKSGDSSYKSKLSQLFGDYFKIKYDLTYENDALSKMSPGKKGTVILKLYLVLSNSIHPILIDQPEDNLDNRTISENLVKFIEDRKSKRQIIMVSHNPNLVVSTDSENVIVANQSGKNEQRDNKCHKFEYVSGALENTYDPHENCITRRTMGCNEDCENNTKKTGILFNRGIREHIFEILEGGKIAFQKRESKYGYGKNDLI